MKLELPDYYFRTRENGAQVFRVSTDNPQQRIEMNPIAAINIRNGEIRPHADHLLTGEDNQAMTWSTLKRPAACHQNRMWQQ